MPKPIKFTYEKQAPYRDAFLFIIVCEGQNREPAYFEFFNGISSRVKVIPVASVGGSNPTRLIDVAIEKEKELEVNQDEDRLWFVIDTDRWREQLHEIRTECEHHTNWRVAQSNPCFEVWLYYHARSVIPEIDEISVCGTWKPYLPTVIPGGFNTDFHPIAIETAIENARQCYKASGYLPEPGSTQVFQLGEELIPLIKKDLDLLKPRFPAP